MTIRPLKRASILGLCTFQDIRFFFLINSSVFFVLTEAKFIGFSMYTTCVIWLAFAAVYFAIDVKVFSLCVATNASAYVVLVFLFFPKLYLIIFRPEKNQRR